jgi:tellurite resistance protein TerA
MSIELIKNGDKVKLEFDNDIHDFIKVNLSWNRNRPRKDGLLSKLYSDSTCVDLDLGCIYEFKNGEKGVIQALGNSFGSLQRNPYILLDGDDRTGDSNDGENILINSKQIKNLKRLMLFISIYEGPANWAQADATVSIKTEFSDEIIIRIDDYDNKKNICSLVCFDFFETSKMIIEKELKFFRDYKKMDSRYNWNLEWKNLKK